MTFFSCSAQSIKVYPVTNNKVLLARIRGFDGSNVNTF